MNLTLTETQTLVQKTAREFAQKVIAPEAARLDAESRFPREILKGLADLGLMAVNVPEDLGGSGAGALSYALAMEEVAAACASTAVTMAVTNMVGEIIAHFGTPAQREFHCPRLADGTYAAGSFALSEAGAGSDPGGMSTTATLLESGEGYVLRGDKQWITSGAHAGVFIVWARTGNRETHAGTRGISCFLLDGGTPGLTIGKAEDKLGLRASNTVPLVFDDIQLPKTALLGELNGGFKIAMMALDGGRVGISAQAVGIARAALAESVQYARDRKQFGKAIGEFQGIQWKLADMSTKLEASRLLCYRAAALKEAKKPFSREASMAKVFASEAAVEICNEAVQIHGGYGYTRDFAAERHLRDVRASTIYEGTSEIQRIVIARSQLA